MLLHADTEYATRRATFVCVLKRGWNVASD